MDGLRDDFGVRRDGRARAVREACQAQGCASERTKAFSVNDGQLRCWTTRMGRIRRVSYRYRFSLLLPPESLDMHTRCVKSSYNYFIIIYLVNNMD